MILFLIFCWYIIYNYQDLNTMLVLLGIIFFIMYLLAIKLYLHKGYKINKKGEEYLKAKRNTFISIFIYSVISGLMFYAYSNNILSFNYTLSLWIIPYGILLIIFHDMYFYFLHRLLHSKLLYAYIHAQHHKSHNPTLWSAYNFHPVEAILYVGAIVPIFFLELNIYALFFAIFVNDLLNYLGHSGYEVFHKKSNNPLFKYIVTASYHDLHHSNNKGNYSLYFSWWDKIFNTHDSKSG